jgi:hypothetical protein
MEKTGIVEGAGIQEQIMTATPEHLLDDDLVAGYHRIQAHQNSPRRYLASVGLLLKLLKGTRRMWKRGKIPLPNDDGIQFLFDFWLHYALPPVDTSFWTPDRLHQTAIEINKICREISPAILRSREISLCFVSISLDLSGISTITLSGLLSWQVNLFNSKTLSSLRSLSITSPSRDHQKPSPLTRSSSKTRQSSPTISPSSTISANSPERSVHSAQVGDKSIVAIVKEFE